MKKIIYYQSIDGSKHKTEAAALKADEKELAARRRNAAVNRAQNRLRALGVYPSERSRNYQEGAYEGG